MYFFLFQIYCRNNSRCNKKGKTATNITSSVLEIQKMDSESDSEIMDRFKKLIVESRNGVPCLLGDNFLFPFLRSQNYDLDQAFQMVNGDIHFYELLINCRKIITYFCKLICNGEKVFLEINHTNIHFKYLVNQIPSSQEKCISYDSSHSKLSSGTP